MNVYPTLHNPESPRDVATHPKDPSVLKIQRRQKNSELLRRSDSTTTSVANYYAVDPSLRGKVSGNSQGHGVRTRCAAIVNHNAIVNSLCVVNLLCVVFLVQRGPLGK